MAVQSLLSTGPIPPPFRDAYLPPFIIVKVTQNENGARLDYILESGGPPINIRSKAVHETLPDTYEASVGGWYGTMGQWSLVERYVGGIECLGVARIKQISNQGVRQEFHIERNFWRNRLLVTMESEQVGMIQLACKQVVPLAFQTLIFDKKKHLWVEKASSLQQAGIPYQP